MTFAAEIGDVRGFDTPRRPISFLGLVQAERSTGDTIRPKGLINRAIGGRGGRSHQSDTRVSETLTARLKGLPKPVRDIAWKA